MLQVNESPKCHHPAPGWGRDLENAGATGLNPDSEETESEAVTENTDRLPWIIGGVLLLGILVLLIRAFLRGRAS